MKIPRSVGCQVPSLEWLVKVNINSFGVISSSLTAATLTSHMVHRLFDGAFPSSLVVVNVDENAYPPPCNYLRHMPMAQTVFDSIRPC